MIGRLRKSTLDKDNPTSSLNLGKNGLGLPICAARSRLPLIISICFVVLAGIGAFGTLAWLTNQLVFAQVNPLFVPIAPLTILLLILLGASSFLYGVRPQFSWFRVPAGVVGVLVVMLTSLTIYHAVMPGSFSIEALMFPNSATLQGYPLAKISPLTAVIFLLGGISLILLVSSSGTRARTGVALFGIAILSCGVVTTIGYLYQAPLLYGSPIIPVSIPAAIAFLFLGTEIWAAAGRDCWPTCTLVGDSVQARLLRAFLPVVALIIVILLGLNELLGRVYLTPLLASLELLGGLAAAMISIARLSRGIGGEIDRGIAERERLQEELRKYAQHLEALVDERTKRLLRSERLAAIGELAAMVGHDLRNPLQAIAGASYLIRTQTSDKLDESGRESLQIINKSLDYSDKIINDLLEYSEEIKLQPSTTNPKAITNHTLSLARISQSVRVLNQTQNEPTIIADKDKLLRAFLNLVSNAVDAMPQGGTLTISSKQKDGLVEFTFADSGTGMPQDVLKKLWTPLFTTKAKGMGFGLEITRRIIEAHGGTITADSTLGKGSTFTVRLPIQIGTREVGQP